MAMKGVLGWLLLVSATPQNLAVVVDLSHSSPKTACQRDLASVSRVLAYLHGTFPGSRITLYLSAAPPGLLNQPRHPGILLSLYPLGWSQILRLKASRRARHAYIHALQNRIVQNLRPMWDSLLSACRDCSALQYSLWEIYHLKEIQKLNGIVLLSDGLDTFPWKQSISVPVVIAGTPSDQALETRIRAIWQGWKVRFLRRDCEPQSLILMLKELFN